MELKLELLGGWGEKIEVGQFWRYRPNSFTAVIPRASANRKINNLAKRSRIAEVEFFIGGCH